MARSGHDRILVVDDQPEVRQAAVRLLKALGHITVEADQAAAARRSPLALALFQSGNVVNVLIHQMNLTVGIELGGSESIEARARRFGQVVREHLAAGRPLVSEDFLAALPAEQQIREHLQRLIDEEINPGIAAHSGTITLTAVKGNSAYIHMGGGCQGCAASSITLRGGIESAFRSAVPELGGLFDETDHSEGSNPFFTELPAGMGA